ncbi:MAG: hypothetical protein M3R36_12550 [Bacteroidota bacterium]|nr:hypothetical protein [Bacteroidota bacterium]
MRNLISLLIFFIFISYIGCGEKNEVSGDRKDNPKIESKKENENQSSQNNESEPEKKDDDKETDPSKSDLNKANELGMSPGMPANFPTDVPTPRNAKTLGSLNSSEGTVVTFESPEKVQDIVGFYKDEMKKNGYIISEGGETLVSDKGGLISWKKDSKEVGLMLGYDKDKNITSLVITYK